MKEHLLVALFVKQEYRLPSLPNFITLANGKQAVDVADLTCEQLEAIGMAWRSALVTHGGNRRNPSSRK